MLFTNSIYALSKSIVFKNIWVAFGMNTQLKERGEVIPDDKREWRYFKHLAGDKFKYDQDIMIISLDTNELIPLDKETLPKHRKTYTYYRDNSNREKIHNDYPEYSLYIDGIWDPVDYSVSINAKEGTILRYNVDLVEPQEINLIKELEDWFRGEVHQYFMESFAAQYPLFIAWFEAKISAFLPVEIKRIRFSKIHTVEVHSYFIELFLKSHKHLDVFLPYLNFKQKIFLYRDIRYIERNSAINDTFNFLVDNVLTERSIPLDGFELGERYTKYTDGVLKREPVGYRKPINFKERTGGRDFEVLDVEGIIEMERDQGVYHDRLLEDYKTVANDIIERDRVLAGPTKLLQVTGVDPNSIRSTSYLERLILEWAYFSSTGDYATPADVLDPQSGNNIRLNPLSALYLFFYSLFKGTYGVELKECGPFYIHHQETGLWYNESDLLKVLPTKYSIERPHIIEYFLSGQRFIDLPYDEPVSFSLDVRGRWDLMSEREAYIASQHHDLARAEAETIFNHIYKTHVLTNTYHGKPYSEFLEELEIDSGRYTQSMWLDLCVDILKLFVNYEVGNSVGFGETQKGLVSLFTKLAGYSIQMVDRVVGSDSISMEPVAALVTDIKTTTSSSHNAFYESSSKVVSSSEHTIVIVNAMGKLNPVENIAVNVVEPIQEYCFEYSVTSETNTTPYYESSAKVEIKPEE